MKLKKLFNLVVNKNNNQIVLNPKKKLIKRLGYDDVDDLLEIELEDRVKKMLYKD